MPKTIALCAVKSRRKIIIQLFATNLLTIATLGGWGHSWLAGLIAPTWILAAPVGLWTDFGTPVATVFILPCIIAYILLACIVLSVTGKLPEVVGHIALLGLNLISIASLILLM